MSEFINTIDVLGDDAVIDGIISRTITEFKDDVVTNVSAYAFYNCTALTEVDLPNVTTVGKQAFVNCTALESVNMPLLTSSSGSQDNMVFANTAIKQIYFPLLTSTRANWFENCKNLVSADLPSVKSIAMGSFSGCESLVSVNLPEATTVCGFKDCTSLVYLNAPKCTSLGGGAYSFQRTTSLKRLDFSALTSVADYGMFYNSAIEAFISRGDTVPTLGSANIFDLCPIGNGTGYIYVPRALVNSYKSATNWSNYASQIRAIEDYPDITGG